jgi:hypothetical protein
MELRPLISIEEELTGGKFYRIVAHTDKEYFVINNKKVKRNYPKSIFEKPGEVFTYAQVTEPVNLGRLVEKSDLDMWKKSAWGKLAEPKTAGDATNNGGSTDYYKIKPEWKDLADIIEDRQLSYNQANVLKAAFTFNLGRHKGTDELREINKIIYFAERQKQQILKQKENGKTN